MHLLKKTHPVKINMIDHKNRNHRKVALITGASRGIGATTALLFAKNGYDIVINYLKNKKQAEETAKLAQKSGVTTLVIKADLSNEDEIVKMFKTVEENLGKISVLVNNGGISGGIKPIEEIDFDYLEKIYKTNVFGTFICCREAFNQMKKSGGSIINISSLVAKNAGFKMSAYSSSKAAISNLTIGLSKEMAEFNIRINAVSPGVIDTDTHKEISPERLVHLKNSIPLKRMGNTEEIAEVILWLASDKSSYVTGSIIEITGGK